MKTKTLKSNFTITNGCGKGKSCRTDLYVQPYSSTREHFKRYAEEGFRKLKEDNKG